MNKAIQFLREAYAELIRVTWPSRSQTLQYTILVVIISLGVAAFLGALDYAFGIGVKDYLLGTPESPALPEGVLNNTIDLDSGAVVPVDGEVSGEVQEGTEGVEVLLEEGEETVEDVAAPAVAPEETPVDAEVVPQNVQE